MKLTSLSLLLGSTAFAGPIAKRASSTTGYTSGDTATDVTDGVCAPLTVIFARGTSETGNIGLIIGPPLFAALKTDLDSQVALQGVNYAADVAGDIELGAEGGPDMATLAEQALSQCPTTKVALAGYSQGGLVIHYALNSAGLSSADVSAIVYFGDPEDGIVASGTVAASKIQENCATGDGVCELHGFDITAAHLTYGSDASEAATFIITTTGVST